MGNRPRHRLPRRTNHLREQAVAHGEVDADAVPHDTPIASCQLQQLPAHAVDVGAPARSLRSPPGSGGAREPTVGRAGQPPPEPARAWHARPDRRRSSATSLVRGAPPCLPEPKARSRARPRMSPPSARQGSWWPEDDEAGVNEQQCLGGEPVHKARHARFEHDGSATAQGAECMVTILGRQIVKKTDEAFRALGTVSECRLGEASY